MGLEAIINEELRQAIKSEDKLRMETLRSIRASIIEFNKSGADRDMNKEDELNILNSQAKKRKDAIEMYRKANRDDLLEKEQKELEIINTFLPKQLSEEEIKETCKKIISEIGAESMKDFGKAMGLTMKELKGKADGAKVQQIIKSLLENNK